MKHTNDTHYLHKKNSQYVLSRKKEKHKIEVDVHETFNQSSLREELNLEEPCQELCGVIVQDATHNEEVVRVGASFALAQVVEVHPSYISATLLTLLDLYEEKLYVCQKICLM